MRDTSFERGRGGWRAPQRQEQDNPTTQTRVQALRVIKYVLGLSDREAQAHEAAGREITRIRLYGDDE